MPAAAVVALKLWLVDAQKLTALVAPHDDNDFLLLARSILQGEWLGAYNNLTLIKGPFYPLWVAAVSWSGTPLLFAQHLLYTFACILAVIALKPLFLKRFQQFLLFVILLFNPMSFTTGVMTQVLREGIYPSLTLLVITTATGFLLRMEQTTSRQWPWLAGLGISLTALWLTREEGVWILPSLLLLAGFAVIRIFKSHRAPWRCLLLLAVPAMIWLAGVTGICLLNQRHYGVFVTTEMKSPEFLDAYGALCRVVPDRWFPTVPLPRDARMRIYNVSRSFAEMQPLLEGNGLYNQSYMFRGIRSLAQSEPDEFGLRFGAYQAGDPSGLWQRALMVDEPHGGWFLWALRDAAAANGHHRSAQSARSYYKDMAREVNDACRAGRLACDRERSSLMPPLRLDYLQPFSLTLVNSIPYAASFQGFKADPDPSSGDESLLALYREMTHEELSPTGYRVNGWIATVDPEVTLTLRTASGTPVTSGHFRLEAVPSTPQPHLDSGALPVCRSRFEITGRIQEGFGPTFRKSWSLTVDRDDKSLLKLPLDGSATRAGSGALEFSIDSAGEEPPPPSSDVSKLQMLGTIARIYRLATPPLGLLALLLWIAALVKGVRQRELPVAWFLANALVVAILTRLAVLSLIHVTSFPTIIPQYLSPVYPLLLLFILLSIMRGPAIFRTEPGRGK